MQKLPEKWRVGPNERSDGDRHSGKRSCITGMTKQAHDAHAHLSLCGGGMDAVSDSAALHG